MKQIREAKVIKLKSDLQDELNSKKGQLDRDEKRLNGGFLKEMNREVEPIDKEIEKVSIIIEMQEIQSRLKNPLAPRYEYELDQKWIELNNRGLTEMMEHNKKILERLKAQKEEIEKRIPELKQQIKELEEKLK